MIKEIALAVTLGALLGFGITGGYIATKKNNRPPAKLPIIQIPSSSPDKLTPTVVTTPESDNFQSTDNSILTIEDPTNESIVANSLINLKGTTYPKGIVIINTGTKLYQANATENGTFQQDIELESGINNIQIDSFDPEGYQVTKTIQITYSTAKI